MTDHKTVYSEQADKYEALIAREDYQGNILRSLEEITPLAGRHVLDLGAGTGRLACLLAPRVDSIRAFDVSAEMLRVAADKLSASGLSNWQTDVADHRKLPVGDHSADLVVSGWSVSYLAVWNPERWREELEAWMTEMKRVLKDIQTGKFTSEWMQEYRAGAARFKGIRRMNDSHNIEEVGAKLRAMMPWIAKNKLVDKTRN